MKTIAIGLATLLLSSVAAAEPSFSAPSKHERAPHAASGELRRGTRVLASADVAARVAPAGAALRVGLVLHHSYAIDASGEQENSYLEGGLAVVATPATLEPQAHLEYLPVPFLVLRAEFAPVRYLGINYGLLNFDSPQADFSAAPRSPCARAMSNGHGA